MFVWSTFWVQFVPAHPVPSDVYPTLISLWTVCQVTAFHLASPICSTNGARGWNVEPCGYTNIESGSISFSDFTHISGLSILRTYNMFHIGFAEHIQGWKNKVECWFEQSKFVSPCPHNINLGYFHNWLLPLYVWVWSGHISKGSVSTGWILWYSVEHNKEIVTSHSFLLQHPSPNKHITSTAGGVGQQHSCQPPLLFLPSSSTSQVHSAAGHPRHEQVLCWWSWACF